MKNIDKYKNQILAIIFFIVYIYLDKPWIEYLLKQERQRIVKIDKLNDEIYEWRYDEGWLWKRHKKK